MCLIASLVIQPLSKFLIHAIMSYGCHKQLKDIVLKNVKGHSSRNLKTSIMFIVCIGFCVFAGCSNNFLHDSTINFLAVLLFIFVFIFFEVKMPHFFFF